MGTFSRHCSAALRNAAEPDRQHRSDHGSRFNTSVAILELAKGKLTTDPDNHTGEGIFFSSKVMDAFDRLADSGTLN